VVLAGKQDNTSKNTNKSSSSFLPSSVALSDLMSNDSSDEDMVVIHRDKGVQRPGRGGRSSSSSSDRDIKFYDSRDDEPVRPTTFELNPRAVGAPPRTRVVPLVSRLFGRRSSMYRWIFACMAVLVAWVVVSPPSWLTGAVVGGILTATWMTIHRWWSASFRKRGDFKEKGKDGRGALVDNSSSPLSRPPPIMKQSRNVDGLFKVRRGKGVEGSYHL